MILKFLFDRIVAFFGLLFLWPVILITAILVKIISVINNADSNITPLLKRVFMFLEDGNWSNADEYCEKVLDIDPECAEAYLGKLMAELEVKRKELLKEQKEYFHDNTNCQKFFRFANKDPGGSLHHHHRRQQQRSGGKMPVRTP